MTIERTGSIVLQSRFFGEIIRKLPEDMFTMEVLDNNQVANFQEKLILRLMD